MISVSTAYLIYILVILGIFALLSLCSFKVKFDMMTRIFLAFLVAAVVTLFLIPHIESITSSEKTWFTILILAAFLIPLGFAVYIVWQKNRGQLNALFGIEDGDHEHYICDEQGKCTLKNSTKREGGLRKTYEYVRGNQGVGGQNSQAAPRPQTILGQ